MMKLLQLSYFVLLGPPEIPVNCSTTVNDSDIQVNCKPGFNGGSTQHFVLQKLGEFEFETLLTADNPNFRFRSYENVTIRICAFNDDFKNIQHCAIPSDIMVFIQGNYFCESSRTSFHLKKVGASSFLMFLIELVDENF